MGRGLSEMQWYIVEQAFRALREDLLLHKIPQRQWFKVDVTTLERPWEVGATLRADVREQCYGQKKLPRAANLLRIKPPNNASHAAFNRAISSLETRGFITRGRGTGAWHGGVRALRWDHAMVLSSSGRVRGV